MQIPRGSLRPGGRTERVRRAVVDAVLALIKAGNLEFSLQDLARLSGVHRSTIYARWPDRASLLFEAIVEHTSKLKVRVTGDWKRDLHRTAIALRKFFSDPMEITMNRLLAFSSSAEFAEQQTRYWTVVTAQLAKPLRDAQLAGAIRTEADPALIVSMLAGTLVATIVLGKQCPSDEMVDAIVSHLIQACSTPQKNPRVSNGKRRSHGSR
jgi:AcrR family transcriptional regulator